MCIYSIDTKDTSYYKRIHTRSKKKSNKDSEYSKNDLTFSTLSSAMFRYTQYIRDQISQNAL